MDGGCVHGWRVCALCGWWMSLVDGVYGCWSRVSGRVWVEGICVCMDMGSRCVQEWRVCVWLPNKITEWTGWRVYVPSKVQPIQFLGNKPKNMVTK